MSSIPKQRKVKSLTSPINYNIIADISIDFFCKNCTANTLNNKVNNYLPEKTENSEYSRLEPAWTENTVEYSDILIE